MTRSFHRLSSAKVSNAKPKKRPDGTLRPKVYPDGGGLYLQVTPQKDGRVAKSWIFRFTALDGKERYMGLSPLDVIGLADAREKAAECRKLRYENVDPIEQKRPQRASSAVQQAKTMTFDQCAEAYMAAHLASGKHPAHALQWKNSLGKTRMSSDALKKIAEDAYGPFPGAFKTGPGLSPDEFALEMADEGAHKGGEGAKKAPDLTFNANLEKFNKTMEAQLSETKGLIAARQQLAKTGQDYGASLAAETAVLKAEMQAKKEDFTLSDQMKQKIRELATEQYNLQHATQSAAGDFRQFIEEYQNSALNYGKATQDFFKSLTDTIENSIISWEKTGKLNAKQLVTDILIEFEKRDEAELRATFGK